MSDTGVRATFHRWDDLPMEKLSETIDRRLVTGRSVMLAHVYLKKGAIVPRHQHENEQYSYVLSGKLKLWTGPEGDEEEHTLGPGDVLVIPSNVPHRAEAVEETLDLDVFNPPRQDWLDGTDDYLRG